MNEKLKQLHLILEDNIATDYEINKKIDECKNYIAKFVNNLQILLDERIKIYDEIEKLEKN